MDSRVCLLVGDYGRCLGICMQEVRRKLRYGRKVRYGRDVRHGRGARYHSRTILCQDTIEVRGMTHELPALYDSELRALYHSELRALYHSRTA